MLIREAADPALTGRQRGALVRALAAAEHTDPDGRHGADHPVDAGPVDPGLARGRVRRAGAQPAPVRAADPAGGARAGGGAEEGEPGPDRGAGAADPAGPARVGAGRAHPAADVRPHRADRAAGPGRRRRCSAGSRPARPNEIWTGDALHGPRIGGRKTYLFAFIDDHSRAVVGHRWGFAEDTVRLAAALRPALAAAGCPEHDLRRQRVGVRGRVAAAGLREARHQAGPLRARAGPRAGARSSGSSAP